MCYLSRLKKKIDEYSVFVLYLVISLFKLSIYFCLSHQIQKQTSVNK